MYTMPKMELPIDESYDVIVLGGGPSGCAAAVAAAREGAKTLIIEAAGFLGGMGTGGLVPFWCGFSTGGGPFCNTGIGKTVYDKLRAQMPEKTNTFAIDAEALKRVYDEIVTEAGVDVLFFTQLAWTDAEDGNVRTIVVCNKGGLKAYRAKVYCDASGDADLAVAAGGKYMMGNEYGETQPATMCFTLTNCNLENRKSDHVQFVDREKYPLIIDNHLVNNIVGEGAVGFNAGHMYYVDSTDPVNASKTMMKGRQLAHQLTECEVGGQAVLEDN